MDTTMSSSISRAVANPGQQEDRIRKLGLDDSQMDRFRDILRVMNLEAIPTYASSIRHLGDGNTGITSSKTLCNSGWVACKVVDLPLCGSFHIVFTLEFDDGVKWMLKISANGHRFDSVAAAALISEARTMQLIKSETTIPVPTVYAFDASSCNALNTPFILMERIDGQPLYRRWFDDDIPKARLEHFRIRALQSLAEAMAQLNQLTLKKGGALEFDTSGRPVGLRGAKVVDAVAMYYRGTAPENHSTIDPNDVNRHNRNDDPEEGHKNGEEADTDNAENMEGEKKGSKMSEGRVNDYENNDEDLICEKGPFKCAKSAFSFDLDRSEAHCKNSVYMKGCYKALRMFLDMALPNTDDCARHFVLTHPDLDVQNVLVAEDGTLLGLIDWDGVASVPREVGCAQYPLWLMRDWVPYYYVYDIREGRTEEDAGYEESPPAELASYRALYAHFMEKEIERQTGGSDQVTAFGTLPWQEAQLTRRSLVMRDLDLAASSPFLTTNLLCHILHQIEQVTEPEWGCIDLDMDSDSSSSSEDVVDSDSDTNSDINCDSDDKDLEPETSDATDYGSEQLAATTPISQADKGTATRPGVSAQTLTTARIVPSAISQLDQRSQNSLETCQIEAQETKFQRLHNVDPGVDCFSKPARLGWGRRLICFSCDVAEKGLRRIAKIGHVLEDAVDEVAGILTKVEIQYHDKLEHANDGEPDIDQQHPPVSEASEVTGTGQYENKDSNQCGLKPNQSRLIRSDHAGDDFGGSLFTKDVLAPIMKLRDIPARKAELIKAEKARKKTQHGVHKAAMKEELKVWEDIALMVSGGGVSLDQLRMNQRRIARLVVDMFEEDEEQEDRVSADPSVPPAAQIADQGAMQVEKDEEKIRTKQGVQLSGGTKNDMRSAVSKVTIANDTGSRPLQLLVREDYFEKPVVVTPKVLASLSGESQDQPQSSPATASAPQGQASLCQARNPCTLNQKGIRKGNDKVVAAKDYPASSRLVGKVTSSVNVPAYTMLPEVLVSMSQPSTPSQEDGSAGGLVHGHKDRVHNDETMSDLSLRSKSSSENQSQPKNASSSLNALCSLGSSRLRKIFSNNINTKGSKAVLTLDGSVNGSHDGVSDTEEVYKSSATSLSDADVNYREDTKANIDGGNVSATAATPAAERHDEYLDGGDGVNDDVYDEYRTLETTEKANSHTHFALAGGLDKEKRSNKPYSRQIHNTPGSGGSVKLVEMRKPATIGKTAGSNDGEEVAEPKFPEDCGFRVDTQSGNSAEDRAEDKNDNDSSGSQGDSDEAIRIFRDDGEFRSQNVIYLLGMGMLDELRLLRMQQGFLMLLEQY